MDSIPQTTQNLFNPEVYRQEIIESTKITFEQSLFRLTNIPLVEIYNTYYNDFVRLMTEDLQKYQKFTWFVNDSVSRNKYKHIFSENLFRRALENMLILLSSKGYSVTTRDHDNGLGVYGTEIFVSKDSLLFNEQTYNKYTSLEEEYKINYETNEHRCNYWDRYIVEDRDIQILNVLLSSRKLYTTDN